MAEEKPKYYLTLTEAGLAMEARALAQGKAVLIDELAVGDADGIEVSVSMDRLELVHEVWRKGFDSKNVSPEDANVTMCHCVIPATEGGFWIREIGVFGHVAEEEEKILYAYGSYAPYYKMLPSDGMAVTHEIIVPIAASATAELTIVVADEGYATKCELDALAGNLAGAFDGIARLSDRFTKAEMKRILRRRKEEEKYMIRELDIQKREIRLMDRVFALEKDRMFQIMYGRAL